MRSASSTGTSFGMWVPPDNLLNPSALHYALEAATAVIGGTELHPGLVRKAASIGWAIATRHPFFDTRSHPDIALRVIIAQAMRRKAR